MRPHTWTDANLQPGKCQISRQNLDKSHSKKIADVSSESWDFKSSPRKEINKSLTDLTCIEKELDKRDSELSRSCEDFSVDSDLLLFGQDINKHPLDGSIDLPSDQVRLSLLPLL